MAAATEKDSVWIGFMDIVPVIGSVRESVELVLALYEGNRAVVQEKEKAIGKIVKEPFLTRVKKSSAPVKPAEGEFSGLRNVREIPKGMINECMMKASKRGTKPLSAAQRQKKVEEIKNGVLAKIHFINQNILTCELKEQLTGSRRGEHVFNNNILRFHSKVLTDFIQKHYFNNLPRYNQQVVNELGSHTLQQNTAVDIQTNMVVDFDEGEFYVNANAVLYGVYCEELRQAMIAVLDHINSEDVTGDERNRVIHVINHMNNLQIYVDKWARDRWIAQDRRGHRATRFEEVRGEVADMYSNHRGFDWCLRILSAVELMRGV